jgi:mgtE-like transporter
MKDIFDKDFKEISITETMAMTGGLIAGTLLSSFTHKLELIPGLFVLLPGFLALKGNIHGSLASRLSSSLHLGNIKAYQFNKILVQNIAASLSLSLLISLVLGGAAFGMTLLVFKIYNLNILWLSVIAAFISNMIMLPVTVITLFWVYNKGLDPDNIMGSYITTIGDIVAVLAILFAISMLT